MQPMNESNQELELEMETGAMPGGETAEAHAISLAEKLATVEKERDEYLDLAQRRQAEFENFRRRNNAVRSEAWEDGARETIAMILPVIDNLERALNTEPERTPFCEGVELVHKQLLDLLEKRGVAVIDRVGEPFDPDYEDAVMQVDTSEGDPGTVASVLQKGYKMGNRIIRHAMVTVVAAE